ncbi:MAG: metal ABC transporter permease, partial [Ruegeria sp.]|nr:metal ABC transporter permease [Ruegeria sp.]
MLDDFMTRATLAGIGVAFAAAPLGCFVVWRRMAYFGDATAHAAILGVALSLTFQMSVFTGALAVALLMAMTVTL